jgi:hypothetical protein
VPSGDITGMHSQRQSPIEDREPDIVEMCEACSDINKPLTQHQVIRSLDLSRTLSRKLIVQKNEFVQDAKENNKL